MIDKPQVGTGEPPRAPRRRVGLHNRVRQLGRLLSGVRARIPPRWIFVVGLFLGAKVVLTLVGIIVLNVHDGVPGMPPAAEASMRAQQEDISPHRWISMWFAWDSFLYVLLGQEPLTDRWQHFSFPLLYPFLARPLAAILGGETPAALLLISNIAFLFLLYYALRLGEQLLGDERQARTFTKYLVLMPAAFLFQAALTESLFLCLALAAFHYAEQRRWLIVGIVGYFLALSRSVGFLVVIPLALLLLRQHHYRVGPRALWQYLRTGWPLALLPSGWLTYMAFCKWQGGDWFAYKHAQEDGWGIAVQNPLPVLINGLTSAEPGHTVRAGFAVAVLAIAVAGFKRAEVAYFVYTLTMVMVPLSIGPPVYKSLLRYLLAAFPAYVILARWARTAQVDTYLTAVLALVQGAFFVLWLTYWTHFII